MPGWKLSCEWSNEMSRQDAFKIFSQEFGNPKDAQSSSFYALMIMIISIFFAIALLMTFCFAFCAKNGAAINVTGLVYRLILWGLLYGIYKKLEKSAQLTIDNFEVLKN